MKVGDVVCYNDGWFLRRRIPLLSIEERNQFTVKAVGDDNRVMVGCSDEEGKVYYQILHTDWLQLTKATNEENEGGDASEPASSQ